MRMITDEQFEEAVKGIANGLNVEDASNLAGFTGTTFYNHVKEDFEKFKRYKRASIYFKHKHLKNIDAASETNWQASAWILERKWKQEFGKIDSIRIEGEMTTKTVNLNVNVEAKELIQRLQELDEMQVTETKQLNE